MKLNDKVLLKQLGSGQSIAAVCQAAGISRTEFNDWWRHTTESRVPTASGRSMAAVEAEVSIERDRWGIPHIYADNDSDLFFAFGYAMAQDRLFQLDYLRRKGLGRLSEILGSDGLQLDTIARTVGINRIAAAEVERLSADVRQSLESFSAGVNALIDECGENLPIEFDLLDYRPHRWTPVDCVAIEKEFQWYLTGRFPVIAIPELAKRTLGEGPLYDEFLLGEADDESIVLPDEYPSRANADWEQKRFESVGQAVGDPDAAIGSNNWVIGGSRTTTGQPMLGSDPHIAFEAVSCWYQAHLCGGSFNVAGMAYVGIPAIMFGRNEHVAWGITNNICSQRDLYQEQTDPEHPDCFLYDGQWEPARKLDEVINVKDSKPVTKTIQFSRNGPVVDEILPPPADETGPVTLNWVGLHQGGWLTAMLAMDRADNVEEFREALRPWHVPTFSLVIADVDGRIGFQTSGRVPARKILERGYRPGWDPQHQWQGLIPFEAMPQVVDPPRGWIASANNRLASDDYPYPLFGCWGSGWRAVRIRQMIESRQQLSLDDLRDMHQDSVSLRAADLVPVLVSLLKSHTDSRVREAVQYLNSWDHQCEPDSVATAIYNVFFTNWCQVAAEQRFDKKTAALMAGGIEPCAGRLLSADPAGWFAGADREEKIADTLLSTIDMLNERFGADMSQWTWSKLHRMPLKHVLSSRGELGKLLDHGGAAVRGDMQTVCNTGRGPDWIAATGAGYRLISDLSTSPPRLMAIDAQSQSGHPGSPHYSDQFDDWIAGDYHEISLAREDESTIEKMVLTPRTEGAESCEASRA